MESRLRATGVAEVEADGGEPDGRVGVEDMAFRIPLDSSEVCSLPAAEDLAWPIKGR